jgi:hypothetical protein
MISCLFRLIQSPRPPILHSPLKWNGEIVRAADSMQNLNCAASVLTYLLGDRRVELVLKLFQISESAQISSWIRNGVLAATLQVGDFRNLEQPRSNAIWIFPKFLQPILWDIHQNRDIRASRSWHIAPGDSLRDLHCRAPSVDFLRIYQTMTLQYCVIFRTVLLRQKVFATVVSVRLPASDGWQILVMRFRNEDALDLIYAASNPRTVITKESTSRMFRCAICDKRPPSSLGRRLLWTLDL